MSLLLKVEEAAAELQIARCRVYELIARGELESLKIGHSRRITAEALAEYVTRLQLEYPPAQPPGTGPDADAPLLYRVAEAAKLLAIGEAAVWEAVARGELESLKIGQSRRITRTAIERYIQRLTGGEDAA